MSWLSDHETSVVQVQLNTAWWKFILSHFHFHIWTFISPPSCSSSSREWSFEPSHLVSATYTFANAILKLLQLVQKVIWLLIILSSSSFPFAPLPSDPGGFASSSYAPLLLCPVILPSGLSGFSSSLSFFVKSSETCLVWFWCVTIVTCQVIQVDSHPHLPQLHICRKVYSKYVDTRSVGALWAPTSSWRPFGPLDFVLRALRALRPCDPRQSD